MNIKNFIQLLSEFPARPYSGRGMFGKQCVAIEGETVLKIIADMMNSIKDIETLQHLLRDAKQDSMGLGVVLYWPYRKWPDDISDYCEETG